jgi:hypothetical protein
MNGLPYSPKYKEMQAARLLLPAYAHMGEVLEAVCDLIRILEDTDVLGERSCRCFCWW